MIQRDADGNALGGVRLPNIDVPLGTYLPTNSGSGFCFLFGSFIPFSEAELTMRYPNHGEYVRRITQHANDAVQSGYLFRRTPTTSGRRPPPPRWDTEPR